MRSKTVAPIFPCNMRRLHLNLPQFSARLHNKIVRIAVAPRLCHSESQLGRLCQKLRLRHLPRRFPVTDPVAWAPSSAFAQTAPTSATASKSPITTPVLMILRSLCPKTSQLQAIPSRFAAGLPRKSRNPPVPALCRAFCDGMDCPRHEAPSDDPVGRGLLSRFSSHNHDPESQK